MYEYTFISLLQTVLIDIGNPIALEHLCNNLARYTYMCTRFERIHTFITARNIGYFQQVQCERFVIYTASVTPAVYLHMRHLLQRASDPR